MKMNELMVGDWVYNKHHGKNTQITPFDFFTHGHLPSGEQYFLSDTKLVTGRDLEPIPLTVEILEHNFEHKGRNYVFSTDFYEVEIHEYNDGMYMLTYTSCEMNLPSTQIANICFVHELQHAMRLCGIGLEIVL